jgi:Ca2+-binding RTX toxin-like protein
MISVRRTHITALGAAVAAAFAFGSAADAMAGTASVRDGVVTYEAAAGERNRVTITEVDSRTVQVRDTVPVNAWSGCYRTELTVARCSGELRYTTVGLGDNDDELIQEGRTRDGSGIELYAVGGEGNDVFHVRSGWLWAMGNAGNDEFHGGSNADTFIGDSYGGAGAEGRDVLYGFGGNDALLGDGGADQIRGGSGRDEIDAGAGSDRIAAADDEADSVKCGDGYDEATLDGRGLDSSLGCEARTYL